MELEIVRESRPFLPPMEADSEIARLTAEVEKLRKIIRDKEEIIRELLSSITPIEIERID